MKEGLGALRGLARREEKQAKMEGFGAPARRKCLLGSADEEQGDESAKTWKSCSLR